MELRYLPHIEIRLVHDKTYAKGGVYKKWTDKKYSSAIHRAVFAAFIASFAIFSVLQTFVPLFNLAKPNVAKAGANNKIWTTKGDFNGATNSGLYITGDANEDDASVSLSSDSGSGANMLLLWDGGAAPSGWEIVSDEVGEPFYQKFIRGAATYGGTGGTAAVHNHTFTNLTVGAPSITVTGVGTSPYASSTHIHTAITSAVANSSNDGLPPYRMLKVIKFSSGIPNIIPTGAIAFFDSTVPNGWTRYSDQDNNFIRGGASITTGGNLNHSHSLSMTTGVPSDYSNGSSSGTIYYDTTGHSHSDTTGASASASNQPLHSVMLLGKADSDTQIPMGLNAMFDNSPSGWTIKSDAGDVLNNKYVKGGSSYTESAGNASHNHTGNFTLYASGYSGGGTSTSGAGSKASRYHAHSVNFTTSVTNNLPTYIDVVMAEKEFPYVVSGTLGGINQGLRVGDPDSTQKIKWNSFSWNGSGINSTYKIKVQVRAADTWGSGDTGYVNPNTNDGTWYEITGNTGSEISINNALATTKTLEVRMEFVGDGLNTLTLNDFTVTYDTLEAPVNSNLVLTKADGTALKNNTGTTITGGVAGAWTNETGIKVTANNLTCGGGDSGQPACAVSSTNLRPQVQVSTTADTTFATPVADVTATAGTTYANITGLTDGTDYHLRVRAVDDQGRVSGWTAYGGNAESATDFSIDQTVPTGTVSIQNGATYATSTSVTLNLDASDTGGSALSQMRFSNDGTFDAPEEDWATYAATKAWTLSSGDGTKTVYAQFRDNAGNISTPDSTDTITLDTAPPTAFTLSSPTNPTYSSTEASPTFNWSASSGHDSYQLVVDGSTASPGRTGISSGSTSTTPAASLSESSHTWTVKAVDAAGNETSATNGPFTYAYDTTAPGNVSNLTAPLGQAGADYIRANWDAATDNGSGIKEYTLEYKLIDDVDYTVVQSGADCNLISGITCRINGLQGGYAYNIRIKVTNNANLSSGYTSIIGYTVDTTDPTIVSNLQILACTKTGTNCSTVDNPNPKAGYELKITWDAAADTGVGIAGYKIYRSLTALPHDVDDFDLVGYFDVNGGPQTLEYFDNDDNNDATFNDADLGAVKTIATTHLNDFVSYYYRINAIDKSGNERDLVDPENYLINYGTGKTVDVTDPAVPADLTPTATGIDNLNNEPLTQAVSISWSESSDFRTPERTPTGNGSGIKEYQLQRALGDINGPTEAYSTIYTGSTPSYSDSNLAEDTYYYYKVKATDNANNVSNFCTEEQVRTKNSQVPTTPTAVTITAKPGDPNTDNEVGYKVNVSFTGSKIKVAENRLDTYKIFRSTTNLSGDAAWTALTPVYEFTNLNIAGEIQDGTRSFTDTVPTDATPYYYKVQTIGFNQANQEIVYSGLSSVTPGTPHLGWDITPDATAPDQPQEVAVKDIHGNTSMYRNIVTWQMIATPLRNGGNDFAKYQVYRFETNQGVGTATAIAEKTDIGDNYHVDGISEGIGDVDYSYYVVAVDNAGLNYKYANNTIINPPYNNISGYSGIRAITPSTVRPTVSNPASSNVGVSSANITWNTNQLCDSLVEYRVKNTETVIAAGKDRTEPVTNHTVGLVGLEKGRTYQYRIVSKNSLGNIDSEAAATWYEFTTQDFAISGAAVTATTTTATVTWNTNINADSSVEYKPESSVIESSTAGDPALTTGHEVVIKGLKPATTYTYKIRSVSADKYVTDTNFATFITKPFDSNQFTLAPSASNVAEENITATSAKIVWNTAIETDTWVDFGTRAGNYSQSAGNEALNTIHVVELKNLTPGTTYFYRVRGKDANFVEYTSKEYSFTAVLKPEIQGLKIDINTPYSAIITFNTNVDTEASVTYGKEGNFDLKAGNSEYKRNHIITLQNLEDDTTYSYFVEVRDKLGNGQRSATASIATPLDKEGPKVENLKIDLLPLGESDEYAQVIISWSTNKPSTTKIEYDEGMISGKYGKSTIEDKSLNSSHTVIIKDLNPSSTYHFRIAGTDKRGNKTESDDYNFVTPEKNKSIWQLIVRSLEETFSWVKDVGGFFRNIGKKAQ